MSAWSWKPSDSNGWKESARRKCTTAAGNSAWSWSFAHQESRGITAYPSLVGSSLSEKEKDTALRCATAAPEKQGDAVATRQEKTDQRWSDGTKSCNQATCNEPQRANVLLGNFAYTTSIFEPSKLYISLKELWEVPQLINHRVFTLFFVHFTYLRMKSFILPWKNMLTNRKYCNA